MFTKSRLFASLAIGLLVIAVALCRARPTESDWDQIPKGARGPEAISQERIDYLIRSDLTGTRGGNLVAAINADPATFNRMFPRGLVDVLVAEQLSADLVHINRITHQLEPSLASRWEVAKDGRTYTIHLRHGLRFSDGSSCTAEDVVFTLNLLLDPKSESIMSDQISVDGKFPTIALIDAYTLRLTWPRPVGTGLRALDSIPVLPKKLLLKASQDGTLASIWGPAAVPRDVVGLGPFRLKEYQRGTRIVFERNPYYWKKDKNGQTLPYLETLTFLVIQDRNSEALRFQAGEIDTINSMTAELYAGLRRQERTRDYTLRDLGPGLGMDFLWFNLNPGKSPSGVPFLDPEKRAVFEQAAFRKAISCAIDREGIVRTVFLGLGTPQFGPISSGNKVWYHSGLPFMAYDLKRAGELLALAGLKDSNGDGTLEYGSGRRPLEITLLTSRGDPARERTAEIIKQNLARVGIRLNFQLLLPNELRPRITRSFDYEAILFGFTPSDIVPDLQADLWYSNGGSHFWYPNQARAGTPWEAEIDMLIARLAQSLEEGVRLGAFRQVQEIWANQMPAIPIVAPNILSGWRNTVGNVRPSILPLFLLWNSGELTKRTR